MIRIRVKLTIVFCIRLLEASAYGAYWDPIAKTNINPKTDLFEKEIEDYGTFKKAMDVLKEQVFGAQMQREGVKKPAHQIAGVQSKHA
jgi:hypothetical protein